MSILIKGIDMPKECKGIELVFIPKDGDIIYNSESMSIGAEQIVEIPTPHGRLIDADLFKEIIKDSVPSWTIGVKIPTYGDMDIMDKICFIPTILEAEGEE